MSPCNYPRNSGTVFWEWKLQLTYGLCHKLCSRMGVSHVYEFWGISSFFIHITWLGLTSHSSVKLKSSFSWYSLLYHCFLFMVETVHKFFSLRRHFWRYLWRTLPGEFTWAHLQRLNNTFKTWYGWISFSPWFNISCVGQKIILKCEERCC